MEPQRWYRIGEIYHLALLRPPAEREAFINQACNGDVMMQREVASLLTADESSTGFLETGIFTAGLKVLVDKDLQTAETVVPSDDEQTDRLVGTTLGGRYLIESELGHGGVGTVYLAHDRKLHDKPVVVKVLQEDSLKNEWVVLKFQQEKEALARVDHPGVVGIMDTGELLDGKPYLVMQFVDGSSLRDAIKAKPEGLELERAAITIKQIGAALNAVHEKKIYHRDLKPENIMLQRLARGEQQVKILDFGIAKVKQSVIAPSTVTGMGTAGTIVYMSPEQLRGDKVTAASDIYSLAIIAYEMITGRRPFNPDTIAHLAEMQRAGVRVRPGDLRPRLPSEAERVILQGLAFDPRDRYQSAAEFGDDLARALLNEEETQKLDPRTHPEIPPTQLSVEENLSKPNLTSDPVQNTIRTPSEPGLPVNFDHPSVRPNAEPRKSRTALIAGLFVLVAALGIGVYLIIANRNSIAGNTANVKAPASDVQRSLAYSLTVQKMRDGKPYQEPFNSSGQEVFENGYKFRLNFSSPQSGYLYVFNEGAPQKDNTNFTIIYPTHRTNGGSAKVDATQSIQTNWNTFLGETGTEKFWIIWSASSLPELDRVKEAAFKDKEGAVTDASLVRSFKDFLTKHADPKPEATKNTEKQQTEVRGRGEVLVKLVELEHR